MEKQKFEMKVIFKATLFLFLLGVILFGSAGSLAYAYGWVFIIVFVICTTLSTLDIKKHDPELLKRRMKAGPSAEARPAQKIIMICILSLYSGALIVAGLDYRFQWSHVPMIVVISGYLLFVLGYLIMHIVMRVNSFAASTIEIAEKQKVISTGPYSLVRHPMYFGGILFFIAIPLTLGSWFALIFAVLSIPILIWRIFDEEKMLKEELDGYAEYCQKVKYRLIPWLL